MADGPDPVLWARVNDVFHRALELPTAQRVSFVRRECADAEAVTVEVLSLLAANDRAADFMTSPAGEAGDRAAAARVGKEFGQYRISRILGVGGMGVVYLAEDLKLGRKVALKSVAPALAADPAGHDRLRREAVALANFQHPGIATVYAFEEFGADRFIASEFVEGETLRDELTRGPFRPARVRAAGIELSRALAAAHAKGVIHRDLKPENIIHSTDGPLKILDFGLARVRNSTSAPTQITVGDRRYGTPGYMSPEQISGATCDGRSDLFALGILLTEALTGVHPFAADDSFAIVSRIIKTEPTIVTPSRSTSPEDAALYDSLVRIVRRLMQKEPIDRFRSADELAATLEALEPGRVSGTLPVSPTSWTGQRRWWRLHQIIAAVTYSVLLVVVAFAADTLRPSQPQLAMLLFLAAMAGAVGAVAIRMHLWFEAASRPQNWHVQYSRSWRWLRLCDVVFIGTMLATGFRIDNVAHNVMATVLVAASVLALVSATLIEPATTRAAFDQS